MCMYPLQYPVLQVRAEEGGTDVVNELSLSLSFSQVTTQLQYTEDSEPVVDWSHNRWCAVQ